MLVGDLRKMRVKLAEPVEYYLPIGNDEVALNGFIGKEISLRSTTTIHCVSCGRKTKKSYSQGYCFPCMKKLPECDVCIVRPEKCHYDAGTCRDAAWGEKFCMQMHYVYLANSSGIKVGITRGTQLPTRWIDQGATQAVPVFQVKTRFQSGLLEEVLKSHVADKTDWRKMLRGAAEPVDLVARRDELLNLAAEEITQLQQRFPDELTPIVDEAVTTISYPVDEYPVKVSSLNMDKQAEIKGQLLGIKGQYLILDTGVLNIRKFTGYEVEWLS